MTNLIDDPETVCQVYCGRGDVENRLKELHHGLEMDRTSCSRFLANQFRVLLTLAAYILFQELRRRAAGTALANAQVPTLSDRLLKLAVWVQSSTRRIVLHLPATFGWLRTWRRIVPSAPRADRAGLRVRPCDQGRRVIVEALSAVPGQRVAVAQRGEWSEWLPSRHVERPQLVSTAHRAVRHTAGCTFMNFAGCAPSRALLLRVKVPPHPRRGDA